MDVLITFKQINNLTKQLKLTEDIDLNKEVNYSDVETLKDFKTAVKTTGLQYGENSKTRARSSELNKILLAIDKLEDKEIFEKYSVGEGEDKKIPEDKLDEADKEHKDLITAEKEIDVANLWSGNITIETLADIETEENYPVLLKLIDK